MNFRIAGVVVILFAVVFAVFSCNPTAVSEGLATGQPAPDFSVPALNEGEAVSLASLKGKPSVLVFWADWCGPCRQEIPKIKKFHEEFGKDVQFVSIAIASADLEEARKVVKDEGLTWTQANGSDGVMEKAFGVTSIPHTVFLDKEGKVVDQFIGLQEEAVFREMVERLVKQQTGG